MFFLHFKQLSLFRIFLFALVPLLFIPTSSLAQYGDFLSGDACFVESTGDNITDYSSADETALQSALDAASFGALLKVAGTCAGTHTQGGRVLTVYINQTLTIRGGYEVGNWLAEPDPTTQPTTLNAIQEGRVIFVNTGGHIVTLQGLNLTGGDSSNGGGIENRSVVDILETTISNNTATANGGGIFNQGGTVTLTNSTLDNNTASLTGGGIYASNGVVNVNTSQITNNSTNAGGGGGIFATGTSSVNLSQSILRDNTASTAGGGLYHEATGLVTILQSTLYDNSAGTQGGGIYINNGLLNITNSTLSGNQANSVTQGGGALAMNGASASIQYTTFVGNSAPFIAGQDGIWMNSGTMTIASSILGSNGTENCRVAGGTLTSNGYNLSSDTSCTFSQTGDQNNTNPNLGPLLYNGGPTPTHFLLPFSPAIDAIPNNMNNCGTPIVVDQRNFSRPVDSKCDKGAVELDTNYPPTTASNAYNLNEDSSLNISAPGILNNDSDGDWDNLTATLNTSVSHGSLTFNSSGAFDYSPVENYCGSDAFTYRAEDGQAVSPVTTVSFNITCINDLPVATNDTYTTLEDTPLTVSAPGVLANDDDLDNDPLTAELNSTPTHGAITLNDNGSFTYTPNDNDCGTDSFTYFANDGTANSNLSTVSLTISCVNDPPVTVGDAYQTTEDLPLTVIAPGILTNDSDIEQDPITPTLTLSPTQGTLTLDTDGSFAYTPAEHFCGSDFFTYYASDGEDNSNFSTVNLTVSCVNDIPEVDAGANATVNEGQSIEFFGEYFDPETNTNLQITWDFGDNTLVSGILTPTHTYPDEGLFAVTLIITDDQGASSSDTIIVTVQNVAPSLGSIPNQTVHFNATVNFIVNYNDPGLLDTHTTTINWRDGTIEPGEIDPIAGTISGSHIFVNPGVYSVIITIQDNTGAQDVVVFTVTVTDDPRRLDIYLPIIIR